MCWNHYLTEYDPPKALVSWLQALYVRSIKVKPLIFPETQLSILQANMELQRSNTPPPISYTGSLAPGKPPSPLSPSSADSVIRLGTNCRDFK